eukprot:TRINITY_DN28946_c0_g1_i1.p2 TRINITY_DN28946_c0_g1~~TRINITY_DN28946_c0_g1_i1.p2  ORF type:complete len:126 (+),score=8.62 TRINITY_DN28946_c0_g1_i1:180-557(+)
MCIRDSINAEYMERLLILLLSLSVASTAWAAELVVAVRSDSEIGTLSKNEVIDIFLGRFRQLPSGQRAEPLDQAKQSPERQVFYHALINKTAAEIDAYWARLLFTGRVTKKSCLLYTSPSPRDQA